MKNVVPLVVFSIDDQKYALHLAAVERIVFAVEVTSLPKAPDIVMGVINVEHRIIPVLNVRRRFHLHEREIDLKDQFILAHSSKRTFALVVDRVDGVKEYDDEQIIHGTNILPDLPYIEGVVALENGMILIHDVDRFHSLEEETTMNDVLDS